MHTCANALVKLGQSSVSNTTPAPLDHLDHLDQPAGGQTWGGQMADIVKRSAHGRSLENKESRRKEQLLKLTATGLWPWPGGMRVAIK